MMNRNTHFNQKSINLVKFWHLEEDKILYKEHNIIKHKR